MMSTISLRWITSSSSSAFLAPNAGSSIISRYLLFRVIVDKRTETFTIEHPKNYKGKDLSKLSKFELMVWMFKNCSIVPFTIKKEKFKPNSTSHRWDHIKTDSYIMDKLESYLNETKNEPTDHVYYYIRKNKGRYYLERDIVMSPRRTRHRRKKKNKQTKGV